MPALFTCMPQEFFAACALTSSMSHDAIRGGAKHGKLLHSNHLCSFAREVAHQHINARGYTLSQFLYIPSLQAIPLNIVA